MTADEWAAHPNFEASEFGEHADRMHAPMIARLQRARALAGVSFEITSAWRSKEDSLAHWLGKAVDIRAKDSRTRFKIVKSLFDAGFVRVFVYYATGHVHADTNTEDEGFDQDVFRAYKGRA